MATASFSIFLAGEADTDRLARHLAPLLLAGDTVLLAGPIGSGKTHFCRAVIRARLGYHEDVPSPTYTIVQTYDGTPDIWHADLYRLTHPDEARELGLEEAFMTAISLVEWPDRLGQLVPPGAIRITLSPQDEGRLAKIDLGQRGDLAPGLAAAFPTPAREDARRKLLTQAGWAAAERVPLAGDASARRYERLWLNGQSRILMDAPPGLIDDLNDFLRIDEHLRRIGLSAPILHDADTAQGFLLLEDLGEQVFAALIARDPAMEIPLYRAAIDVLVHLQGQPPAPDLANLSAQDWAEAALVALDWYGFAITGARIDGQEFTAVLADLLSARADGTRTMILRDYHAENLMWLPRRSGLARVGLLDFQLAQMGQPGYDLVSLLQDARRDVGAETETALIKHFIAAKGIFAQDFAPAYAALGAQRALRILGIFARLCLVEGKAGYLALIPRVWGQLQRNLAHPDLTRMRQVCDKILPPPSPENLRRIEGKCGAFR